MNIFFSDGAQKFMGVQKLLRVHDASASLRHPQMAPDRMFFLRRHRSTAKERIIRPTVALISDYSAVIDTGLRGLPVYSARKCSTQ